MLDAWIIEQIRREEERQHELEEERPFLEIPMFDPEEYFEEEEEESDRGVIEIQL
jgi:hypothetical protein